MATTRLTAPRATIPGAPSHSPPDTLYAPGHSLAQALGWFSVGLGLAELLAPRAMADLTGVRHPNLIQAYGLRELACGIGILSQARPAEWLWGRVAGDALDLGTLGVAMAEGNSSDRTRAMTAFAAVLGVTALDAIAAGQLSAAAALEG